MAPEWLDRPRWQGHGLQAFLRVRTLAARVEGTEWEGPEQGQWRTPMCQPYRAGRE